MTKATIPYKPREAFLPLHDRKTRWALVVAHRRAGKTVACINELIRSALEAKLPNSRYAYIAPYYKQAKSVCWDYLKRYTAVIGGITVNESELRIDFPRNGSRITLYGADKADALRGLYFDGLIADEYGDWRGKAWEYVIRPALADRQGWAIIIGTPKGKNDFWERKCHAEINQDWTALTIKASDSGLLPIKEMQDMQDEMTEDAWRQEMECDFDAAIPGAIFGKEMWNAEQEGRIYKGVYDPKMEVYVAMDLGRRDATAIIWFQVDKEIRIIDTYTKTFTDPEIISGVLASKPYDYHRNEIWIPHDGLAKTFASPRSAEQQFMGLGWNPRIVPRLSILDGIQGARVSLKTAHIESSDENFLNAIRQYQCEYDEDKKCFTKNPLHDWTSHYADALRYACIIWRIAALPKPEKQIRYPQDLTFDERLKRHIRSQREE